jgi:hypothetical protein
VPAVRLLQECHKSASCGHEASGVDTHCVTVSRTAAIATVAVVSIASVAAAAAAVSVDDKHLAAVARADVRRLEAPHHVSQTSHFSSMDTRHTRRVSDALRYCEAN